MGRRGKRPIEFKAAPTPSPTEIPAAPEGMELVELLPFEAAHASRAEEAALAQAGRIFAGEMQHLARAHASSDPRFSAAGSARVIRHADGRWFFELKRSEPDAHDHAKETAP